MKKRNLMSANENALMRAYRENPKKFKEVLQTGRHEYVERGELKKYLISQTEEQYSRSAGGAGLGVITAMATALAMGIYDCLSDNLTIRESNDLAVLGLTMLPAQGIIGAIIGGLFDLSKRKINSAYQQLRSRADKNIGARRVENSSQLEFLFEGGEPI